MAVAVVLLVIAGALVYVFGNATTTSPRARLESALVATKSALDADVTVDVKVSAAGLSLAVTGTGAVDFANKAESLHMTALGQTITVVLADNVLYEKVGKLFGTEDGKTWVRMPVSDLASQQNNEVFVTNDPQQMMAELVKLGATVTPTGTSTIDGTQDEGYQIQLTFAALRAHAAELPPSMRSLFSTGKAPKTATVSATMYVDPSGQLQAAHVFVSGTATGHTVTASIDVTMSNFGSATVAAPPPETQTVTYQQLKGSLGSSGLSATSSAGTSTG